MACCPGARLDDIGLQLDSFLVIDPTLSVNTACNGPLASDDVWLFNASCYPEDAFSGVFHLSWGEFPCQVLLKLLVALNTNGSDQFVL